MRASRWLLVGVIGLTISCHASIPSDRYGVEALTFEGNEVMDGDALAACLATTPRSQVTIQLGSFGRPSCGQPPFEGHPARLRLWRWPWTRWPVFDELLFERDLERILRWYEARGYINARVVSYQLEPVEAQESDVVGPTQSCDRWAWGEGCRMRIHVVIEEGEPLLISQLRIEGTEGLEPALIEQLEEALAISLGGRFDEAHYDASKAAMISRLIESSYARASIGGRVVIDPERLEAEVTLDIEPGPACVFGEIRVTANEDLPVEPIIAAANLVAGQPYSTDTLREAQLAVHGLGAFASVTVRPIIPESGNVVDVEVEAVPAQRMRFEVGFGLGSGIVDKRATDTTEQVPQWDVHLTGSWEHRNLFGGMRRLRIEERPQMVFPVSFPRITTPQFGNTLQIDFRQPAFIEARTVLRALARWDLGPDPFIDVFRHEIDIGVWVDRFFLERRLFLSFGLRELFYAPTEPTPVASRSDLSTWEQFARLDLRDRSIDPSAGFYASLSMQQSGFLLPSSWRFVRFLPEVRGYVPLGAGIVLAARVSLGAMIIFEADSGLDPVSQERGPTTLRFRGGGTTSNRGFPPGELGDGSVGGTLRWLAAAELRFPLTAGLSIAAFADSGDVSTERFRFDYPQLSTGGGLRLVTPFGIVRFDVGWRVPGLQHPAGEDNRAPGGNLTEVDLLFVKFPGAINLIIGDSF